MYVFRYIYKTIHIYLHASINRHNFKVNQRVLENQYTTEIPGKVILIK